MDARSALKNDNLKMKKMKKILLVFLVALSLNGFAQQKDLVWHTDVNKAINISTQSGKPLFLFFTGSDWCGWCKKLVAEVFEKPEFKKWASKNIVLVELDFPKRTPISEQLQKQNRELQQMFGVRGYPSGWFVTPKKVNDKVEFNKLGSQGYVRGGANAWINGASQIISFCLTIAIILPKSYSNSNIMGFIKKS